MAVVCDLSAHETIESVVTGIIEVHGAIDILDNNAGTIWGAPAEEHPLDGWKKVFDLNVTGLFVLTQAVGRHSMLRTGRGRILNIASVEGLVGIDPRHMKTIAYNASKGAVVNMTRALAAE
ncbi:hypothetical protein CI15_06315 [Paraburkholderia monticola]|uniref:Short-chain dehydrogenase n=1 Tax=Paraburkholderia monticola TaxID=1399968 RepID=A0A149PXL6_9BURK|nr:hypothetical protein CI15_06315 [Paraburkholderia monticola]